MAAMPKVAPDTPGEASEADAEVGMNDECEMHASDPAFGIHPSAFPPGIPAEGVSGVTSGGSKKTRKRGPVSEKQRAANKASAARSTGPRTDEGKARSAANALDHGIYAEAAVLPGEDEEELEAIKTELAADYQPRGAIERMLIGRLASISFKLRRLGLAEMDIGNRSRFRRREIYEEQVKVWKLFPQAPQPKWAPEEGAREAKSSRMIFTRTASRAGCSRSLTWRCG